MKRLLQFESLRIFVILAFLAIGAGCSTNQSTVPTSTNSVVNMEGLPLPTPAKQLDEIIQNISSDDPGIRLVSIRALDQFGDEAVRVVPELRKSLFDPWSDIQYSAAIELGRLGPKAADAVPDLLTVLKQESNVSLRARVARSLGEIGVKSSVPILANLLNSDNVNLAIDSAEAIAKITGEHFTDSGYASSYGLNDQGIPYIVIDARKWWQEKGQYQEWIGNEK